MDLGNELEALKNENIQLKNALDQSNAEKLALDGLLIDNLKNALQVKARLILIEAELNKVKSDLAPKPNNDACNQALPEVQTIY